MHLKHRNLVTLYEVIDDPSHHTLYLVLEYCERGPLLKAGKDKPYEPISEEANRRATRDVLRGLEYLHAVNIVHRDVKPENVVRSPRFEVLWCLHFIQTRRLRE